MNGLPACSWVPLVDCSPSAAESLLRLLGGHGIAACARAPGPRWSRQPRPVQRVWVDVVDRARAEDVLRKVMPTLEPAERFKR